MRRIGVLAVIVVVAAACGRAPTTGSRPRSPAASPEETTEATAEPSAPPLSLPGASCKQRGGGSPRNIPDFVAVDVESKDGVDRVTFRFRLREPGATQPPSHFVKFAPGLSTGAEGAQAEVEGETFVVVVFSAFGVDLSTGQPEKIYTGPTELKPGLATVRELEQLGDFEATVTWGIGLSRKACFIVDAQPDRLVLEFPSS